MDWAADGLKERLLTGVLTGRVAEHSADFVSLNRHKPLMLAMMGPCAFQYSVAFCTENSHQSQQRVFLR